MNPRKISDMQFMTAPGRLNSVLKGGLDGRTSGRIGDNSGHAGVETDDNLCDTRFHTHDRLNSNAKSPDIGTYHGTIPRFYKNRYRKHSQRDESGVGKPTHTSAEPTGATFCRVLGFLVSRDCRVSSQCTPETHLPTVRPSRIDTQPPRAAPEGR